MSFIAQIDVDITGFSKGIDKAQADINSLRQAVEQNLTKIGQSFDRIGKRMSVFTAAFTLVSAKAFTMAADFQDAVGATDQIFKESSEAAKEWAESLSPSYGIAKKEALEYQNLMGTMLQNIGNMSEDQAQKQAASLIELAGDLTAMYGGRTQDAVRALTGALKGNNTMLDNYGMAVNDAMIKQKALELGLISTGGELSLQAKQAATLALIWEQTAEAQGQAAREADSSSGAIRSLRVEITNLATEMGEVLLPIITPIIVKIREFVSMLRNLSPEMQTIIIAVGALTASIGPALIAISKLIALAQGLGTLKLAFAALTGPIGLITAAIAGAVVLIIKNWDIIKEYFTTGEGAELFNTLKSIVLQIKDEIVGAWNILKTVTIRVWDAIGGNVKKAVESALSVVVTVLTTVVQTFENVAQVLHGIFTLDFKLALEGLKNLFSDIFNGISKIVLTSVSLMANNLATFFEWIGLDKWSKGLQSFSDKISASMKSSTTVTKQAAEEQVKAVEKITTNTKELGGELDGLFRDSNDVFGLIRSISTEITVLTDRLKGLRNGTIEVANVHAEIEKVEERIKDLKSALDTLTGGRELNLNIKSNTGISAWMNTSMFRDFEKEVINSAEYTVKTVNGMFANVRITPKVDTSAVEAGMGQIKNKIVVESDQIASLLSTGIQDLAQVIGDAFGGNWEGLGAGLLNAVGRLAQQFGGLVIGMAVAADELRRIIVGNPFAAIAAGAALIALGAAATSAAGRMVSNATGGGYSGGASYTQTGPSLGYSDYRGAYQDDWSGKVVFEIGNDKLVGVLEQANKRNNRLG